MSGGDVGLKLVVGRDLNRVLALDFGLGSTPWRFEGGYIARGASSPVGVVLTEMFTVKLELETSDGFIAARVVANDPNFRGFPNIVLIAVKHDLGDALSSAKADKSADFVFQRELEITDWEDQGGSEDVDESLASELRNLLLLVGPHVVVLWRELGLNEVLDLKLSMFVVTGKEHACGQPVWQLHRERVGVLSRGWLPIRPVRYREHKVDNLLLANVRPGRRVFAVAVNFAEPCALFAVEADREIMRWERLALVDVNNS